MPILPPVQLPKASADPLVLVAPPRDYSARAREREQQWRQPYIDKAKVRWLMAMVLALNVLLVGVLDRGMRVPAWPLDGGQRAMQVSLIEPPEAFAVPPPPEPALFVRKPSAIQINPPQVKVKPPPSAPTTTTTTEARIGAAGTNGARLFNPDGSLKLPEAPIRFGEEKIANPQEAAKARWAEIEKRGENPLDCTRTRFAQAFRTDQSLGDAVASKYLAYIGLANRASIEENARQREQRAADGCDPPPR